MAAQGYKPSNLAALKDLSDLDRAYMAGIFDGEGSVSIRLNKTRTCDTYRVVANVTSTSIEWLVDLKHKWGDIGYLSIRTKVQKSHFKPSASWMMVGATAKAFLKEIFPYLGIKRERTKIALEFESVEVGHRPTPEQRSAQKFAADELSRLNQRGVTPITAAIH